MRPSAFSRALALFLLLGVSVGRADAPAGPRSANGDFMVLNSSITAEALPSAFAAPPWSEVRALSLRDQPRDASFLGVLFAQPAMALLERLDLSGVMLGRDGALALAGATMPALRPRSGTRAPRPWQRRACPRSRSCAWIRLEWAPTAAARWPRPTGRR